MYARPRLPDLVRAAAVRALVIVAVTLVQLMIAVFCSLAEVWLAFPMVISTVASTVVATWAVLDVWITRQVWRQRHGVFSEPSSVARERALARARPRQQATQAQAPQAQAAHAQARHTQTRQHQARHTQRNHRSPRNQRAR
ncbi:hypothetical protein AN218_07870 [Streptomyces nanshensis]|uniref:Uncharacterized protein n=1 Tax=Streptomyces nanshensis TaxID=518642 RepID=A0A1E7L8U9_9ACTN|nr:hypothetical protein [Streptomyces nanshensis]OEV12531.1 hypothetical protein AN218_07870 [Streptomyces nanshensis]